MIEALPSALIYLDHRVEEVDGKEVLNYYAYCRKTFVKSLDSQVNAKNRYGLPTVLKLTNASFYKTLLSKLPKVSEPDGQPQPRAEAQLTAKGAK
jgi:transposase